MLQLCKREQSALSVSNVGEDAESHVLATLTLAFTNDPPNRWIYPEPADYLKFFPRFAQALGGAALANGTAFANRDFTGVALWLSPEASPDEEAMGRLIEESVAADKQADLAAVIEQMVALHPEEPHWYLPFVGVDPARHGQGIGTALLRPMLERCDAERLPAYLESTNPRNRPLYERLGFAAIGEIKAGCCPPIVPMLRRPN